MRILALALALMADDADPYYKFEEGTAWSYTVTDPFNKLRDAKATLTITRSGKSEVAADMVVYSKKPETTHLVWAVENGILFWGEKKTEGVSQAFGVFKLGSKKGDTWSVPATEKRGPTHSVSNLGTEEVKVPAGVYKDALRIRIDWRDGASVIRTELYLVEKVGLVKMTQAMDGKLSSMELAEMKPAK